MSGPVIYKSDAEAAMALQYWQRLLGLADWDVRIKIVPMRDMQFADAQGENIWALQRKQALIRLCHPDSNNDDHRETWPQDHEKTLIHELLHLHTVWWQTKPGTEGRDLEEQMLNLLARAFAKLKRGGG